MKKLLLLATVFGLLGASIAYAQGGAALSWTNCDQTNQDVVLNCASDPATPNPLPLIFSFVLAAPLPDFSAVQGKWDIAVLPGNPVPDYWRAGPTQCREGLMAAVNVTILTMCTNPYSGTPTQGGGLDFQPHPTDANKVRNQVIWARGGDSSSLNAGTRYAAARVNIAGDGSSACAGCSTPTTHVIAYLDILGQATPPIRLENAYPGGHLQTYTNGGAGPTPTAKTTWGGIKNLYR